MESSVDEFLDYLPAVSRQRVIEVADNLANTLEPLELAGVFCAIGVRMDDVPEMEDVVNDFIKFQDAKVGLPL